MFLPGSGSGFQFLWMHFRIGFQISLDLDHPPDPGAEKGSKSYSSEENLQLLISYWKSSYIRGRIFKTEVSGSGFDPGHGSGSGLS